MIEIKECEKSEMIEIMFNGKCLFYGNACDFNRDGESFKRLFEAMEMNVTLVTKDYDNWENKNGL